MKHILFAILSCFLLNVSIGQSVYRVTLNGDGSFETVAFMMDDNVVLNLSKEGNVMEYGTEVFSERIRNFTKLVNYPGRIEFYNTNDNEAFRGKVKYIGKTLITYFASFDDAAFVGKVKSIGTLMCSYYSNFDNEALKGNLKKAGSRTFDWYTTYDNEAFRGKLKSLGTTTLQYYTSFDDQAFRGKIKSIDRAVYTYYSSFERREFNGAVKSGIQSQTINGVIYFIKF